MNRQPAVLQRSDWATDDRLWRGRFEGRDLSTGVTVLFFASERTGAGPVLHVHPYDEVFIVRVGRALFTLGSETVTAEAGQILLCPAHVPHKFANLGPGLLETTDIHLSDRLIQTDLPDPQA
jgi:mannose-6-phosphate isomerase-like protein (cupin superfamily)